MRVAAVGVIFATCGVLAQAQQRPAPNQKPEATAQAQAQGRLPARRPRMLLLPRWPRETSTGTRWGESGSPSLPSPPP